MDQPTAYKDFTHRLKVLIDKHPDLPLAQDRRIGFVRLRFARHQTSGNWLEEKAGGETRHH